MAEKMAVAGLDELTKEKVGGLVVKLYSKRGCDAFF